MRARQLNQEQIAHIDNIKMLTTDQQQAIYKLAEALAGEHFEAKLPPNVVPIFRSKPDGQS